VTLGFFLVVACGGGDAREMRPEAGVGQQGASTGDGGMSNEGSVGDGSSPANDGPVSTCSEQVGSCLAQSIAKWNVLLDAADFGVGARLVALGGQAVLVALGDGSFRVALIDDNYEGVATTTYSSWSYPSGGRAPVAISEGATAAGDRLLFVLACEQDRATCAVSRTEVGADQLSTWQSTDVPDGFGAQGLVFDAASEQTSICVYGSGLTCLNGS
jgi:hypothetical protein